MSTDIEQELRELFREKADEAPLSTPRAPATAPLQVLRHLPDRPWRRTRSMT